MTAVAKPFDESAPHRRESATQAFRLALTHAHGSRMFVGEVEAAAARFCRELRLEGYPPERTVKEAKQIIRETIAGQDVAVAERAVQSCIRHYYRDD
mgnify:CR=1 FL=1